MEEYSKIGEENISSLEVKLAPHRGGNSQTDSASLSRNSQELARVMEVYRVMEVAGHLCRRFQVEEMHRKTIKL